MNDLVSVITPCYNSEKFIAQTIDSVLAQDYRFWELIIVDDCSTDGSKKIITEYIKQDSRIKLVTLRKNFGLSKARNAGVEAASGRYIALLDSDDQWLAEKLTTQVKFMRSNNLAFTYSSYRLTDEKNNNLGAFISKESIAYHDLLKTCSIGSLTAIYDTKIFGKIYVSDNLKLPDYVLFLGILKKIPMVYGIKTPLAIYRINPQSYSSNKLKVAGYQWQVYRKIEKLGLLKSCYYFLSYGFYGFIKYKFLNSTPEALTNNEKIS